MLPCLCCTLARLELPRASTGLVMLMPSQVSSVAGDSADSAAESANAGRDCKSSLKHLVNTASSSSPSSSLQSSSICSSSTPVMLTSSSSALSDWDDVLAVAC